MAGTGNQTTVTFATSGFTASIVEVGGQEETREALEDSHLGTQTRKTKVPDDLYDAGESSLIFFFDGASSSLLPISGAAETITRTFPLRPGQTTPATLVGTGFVTRRKWPDARNSELMQAEGTITWDGKTGPTYTAGS
jgi:hypothetical protein